MGTGNTHVSIKITQSIAQIELLEEQITELEETIILTILRISFINGAMILSMIGDISRFTDASKLLAYAGLDPSINQSSKFQAQSTRMSRRGCKLVRYALVHTAWNVSLNNKTFDAYYKAEIAQDKNHYIALG